MSGGVLAEMTSAAQGMLSAKDVPLVGQQAMAALPAGLFDAARIPSAEPLEGLGAINFGNGLMIWPWLLAITTLAAMGTARSLRRWRRDELLLDPANDR